ncbi:flagellar assembly peptidoglycan hydrolase FlgJ [Robbsia sp. KACC 23696]|uniref:flagellar assembly peptidoglycan hydrolase FlgJ n=1 Tax=Robbsia sp. KACC 23696 TaxID=3149231 RepID=UPI00325B5770
MNDMKSSGVLGGAGGMGSMNTMGPAGGGDLSQRFSLDVQGFDALRRTAHDDPAAVEKTVAKQVDASFLSMMLKSMRDATPQNGLMDSQDGKTYQSMLDGQITQELSNKGVGLADTLLKQLSKQGHGAPERGGAGLKGADAFDAHSVRGAGALGAAAGVQSAQAPTQARNATLAQRGNDAQAAPRPEQAGKASVASGAAGVAAAAARAMQAAAMANAAYEGSNAGGEQGMAGMGNMGGGMAAMGGMGLSAATALNMQGAGPGVAMMNPAANPAIAARMADMNMYDRSKLTTQERVAAVEAAAIQAGWRPSHTEVSPLAAGSQGYGQVAQRGSLDNARAFGAGAPAGMSAEESKPIQIRNGSDRMNAFLERLTPAAEAASRETGIPSHFILSQIALESGWGKSEIRGAGGERTHNVLGVKAGDDWKGPTTVATTTEYVNGHPQKMHERFRVYGSYKEALKDYADVLTGNARYAQALRGSQTASGFAHGMQRAGYATDPNYARKLMAIIKQMV